MAEGGTGSFGHRGTVEHARNVGGAATAVGAVECHPAALSVLGGGSFRRADDETIEFRNDFYLAGQARIGAYVVCAWLLGIVINLLIIPGFFDIALRDFGLALGALALGRLSEEFSS